MRAQPLEGELFGPEGSDTAEDNVLVARLMRIAMMCLGEMDQTLLKVVQRTDANGKTVITAAQIKARVFDAAGAVSAIGQLVKLTGVEVPTAASTDEHDISKIPGRAQHEAAMSAFARMAEEIRKREAEKVKTRSNGHAKANGTWRGTSGSSATWTAAALT